MPDCLPLAAGACSSWETQKGELEEEAMLYRFRSRMFVIVRVIVDYRLKGRCDVGYDTARGGDVDVG
jgi:hypothetical protein